MKKYPVILDLDTGIDDAVALVFASALENIDLKLVTTVFGNVDLDKVVKNTLVILEDMRDSTPVVVGERKPIKKVLPNISAHGKNGLGNYTHDIHSAPSKKNYLEAIHEVVSGNEMTYIICCGPLTNMAKYIEKYPRDNKKICIILVTGQLDVDPKAPYINFNIGEDMEAFKIVLSSYKNKVIVPSDMGHLSFIPSKDFDKTRETGRVGKILGDMFPYHMDRTVKNGAALHDLCGVLWLSNPELFETKTGYARLIESKRGPYLKFYYTKTGKTNIAVNINIEKMHNLYYKTLRSIK